MSKGVLIGGAIALLIIVIVAVSVTSKKWVRDNNVNYVYGRVAPAKNSTDGTIKYIGKFTTQDAAEAAAYAAGYTAYTWHSSQLATDAYGGMAYGMTVKPVKTLNNPGIMSATLI